MLTFQQVDDIMPLVVENSTSGMNSFVNGNLSVYRGLDGFVVKCRVIWIVIFVRSNAAERHGHKHGRSF